MVIRPLLAYFQGQQAHYVIGASFHLWAGLVVPELWYKGLWGPRPASLCKCHSCCGHTPLPCARPSRCLLFFLFHGLNMSSSFSHFLSPPPHLAFQCSLPFSAWFFHDHRCGAEEGVRILESDNPRLESRPCLLGAA